MSQTTTTTAAHRTNAPVPPPFVDEPRTYEGTRTRRSVGFLLDGVLILALSVPVAILIAILGLLTLGLGWGLYAFMIPAISILYIAMTLGGSAQSTLGMRLAGVRIVRLDGAPIDPAFAVLHGVLFWATCTFLTPLVLLIALFGERRQTLHDYLLGTVAIRRR